jgi:hypothetical protein
MTVVATYPDSTKTSLEQRLRARARERWPQIASLQIRHRGNFSYVDAVLTDATTLKLCRLRYVGSASQWQFAIYRASHDDYDESVFFTGLPVGTCQDALDTACGLYLNDPTAWIQPPTNLRARPLSHLIRGMDASRENPGWCGSRRAGACCRVTAEVGAALRAAGWDGWRGLPVTPAHLGMRTRHLAWRWGLDLRVAHCCLEHAGQYSGPGARRPGPPGSPLLSHQLKHRRKR